MQPETMPRQTIGPYANYAEAERAVDFLSGNSFPVDRVAIIGADLTFVEQVTGRRGYLKATVSTALSGAEAEVAPEGRNLLAGMAEAGRPATRA